MLIPQVNQDRIDDAKKLINQLWQIPNNNHTIPKTLCTSLRKKHFGMLQTYPYNVSVIPQNTKRFFLLIGFMENDPADEYCLLYDNHLFYEISMDIVNKEYYNGTLVDGYLSTDSVFYMNDVIAFKGFGLTKQLHSFRINKIEQIERECRFTVESNIKISHIKWYPAKQFEQKMSYESLLFVPEHAAIVPGNTNYIFRWNKQQKVRLLYNNSKLYFIANETGLYIDSCTLYLQHNFTDKYPMNTVMCCICTLSSQYGLYNCTFDEILLDVSPNTDIQIEEILTNVRENIQLNDIIKVIRKSVRII